MSLLLPRFRICWSGVNLITDEDRPVHVSGHPARDELVEMYGLVRPQIAIPVHGTARHLWLMQSLLITARLSRH